MGVLLSFSTCSHIKHNKRMVIRESILNTSKYRTYSNAVLFMRFMLGSIWYSNGAVISDELIITFTIRVTRDDFNDA